MRKITSEIVAAFLAGEPKKSGNTRTDGQAYYLHGHKIAEKEGDTFKISTCGWNTPTTKDRLNGLPGVRISTKGGQLFLNGKKWSGNAVNLSLWDALPEGLLE